MSVPKVQGLNCPNCGGALTIRTFGQTLSVVCPQCLSILDAKDPNLQILQKGQTQHRENVLIPLGTRGKLGADTYEAIGFQVRTVDDDGEPDSWREYLLFNPYKGFRYLTEYNGHWNDVKTVQGLPIPLNASGRMVKYVGRGLNQNFKLISTAKATTTYVLGEFPWQVRTGETVEVKDYVATPRILSSETTENETVWSMGEYMPGAAVWEAFKLPGQPPAATGIFENQPSPYAGKLGGIWTLCLKLLLTTFALALAMYVISGREQIFHQGFSGTGSVVTPQFDVKGRPSNLQVSTRNLASGWLYLRYALVNEATGQARDFGRQLEDNRRQDSAIIPSVAAGRYYLRIEPEAVPGASPPNYDVLVRRDVPSMYWFWIAGLLLLIPPAILTWRTMSYEVHRWTGNL